MLQYTKHGNFSHPQVSAHYHTQIKQYLTCKHDILQTCNYKVGHIKVTTIIKICFTSDAQLAYPVILEITWCMVEVLHSSHMSCFDNFFATVYVSNISSSSYNLVRFLSPMHLVSSYDLAFFTYLFLASCFNMWIYVKSGCSVIVLVWSWMQTPWGKGRQSDRQAGRQAERTITHHTEGVTWSTEFNLLNRIFIWHPKSVHKISLHKHSLLIEEVDFPGGSRHQ